MATDAQIELVKMHAESQSKQVYFLLGATGAALGYALQKIDGVGYSWWSAPAVAALTFWLASFYCGCRRIVWAQAAMYANYGLLQLRAGTHPDQPNDPRLVVLAMEGVNTALNGNSAKAAVFLTMQFAFLMAGVLCFVVWRLMDMLKITLTGHA